MQYGGQLKEEKRKILNLVKSEYVNLDFSKLSIILDNNAGEPRWMDTYVMLYKANLPADITCYNILLEKLSSRTFWFYYESGDKHYLANANELMIKAYVHYLISNEKVEYFVNAKYIPHKDYIKEILKISKFSECGIDVEHIKENEFVITPLNIKFKNIEEAKDVYDNLLDLSDFYKNVNVDKQVMLSNYEDVLKLSKDKRMLATVSNVTNYFDCKFNISDGNITFDGTDVEINNESSATNFQAKIIDAYHFFRNVINTKDKKDIISEIYNKKVDLEIKEEFEKNIASYINVMTNKDLIDWIITISKESGYSLKIEYDEQGIFYVDGAIIVTPLDAKEYYIDYMDKKKEKLAMTVYKNTIVSKIKRLWNRFKARFALGDVR